MKPGDRVTYYRQRKPHGQFAGTFVRMASEFRARIELDQPYGKDKFVTVDVDALEARRAPPALPTSNEGAFAQGSFGYRG